MRIRRKSKSIEELDRPAIVFAPHPDDETLGCGGTIVRKLAQGAEVEVVFITDGSRSHDLIPSKELATLRRSEALNACSVLGVEERRVHFLDLGDGRLAEQEVTASVLVSAVLTGSKAEEVFVTHRSEPSTDHAAANRIVRKAALETGRALTLWEYPIWYWDVWPWMRFEKGTWRHPWAMTKAVSHGLPNLILPRGLNCFVDVSQQLGTKRAALEQHRSQMTRFNGDPKWTTLVDRAGGRFLDMLLQPQEFFLRYDVSARMVG
jgi:LmbE family N-acetylglucosaminyl deacetylase